ncbi:MAG: hypothetical protein A2087_11960 [Spirochaetes bacterium GWD1_61_31]|nr:MAG: hypothetical protein A2Y37_07080 [Spirochaetes bacterium GWB1_60_80]OHD30834.1 MAG: hypothetical protein A2004_04605 [Spirochaetes bacterium GWC1_61_12]OHD37385.1 MAG: hypothetical protein A2087_11960 [Spirochaetes bacterium GWD1_61_31]OHD46334.1 MAG: hypothetical protein A2Y35_07355 [Spirochaetes bacterium GWE1_60_18]OHD60941.1 MAG: hypothetical protein A2Y32_12100 [Spirochaetes bacterium GWF1_60_12]HAP42801.1 molecular chaperone Hsp20 [Spirochaetaceae bacterium]
MKTLLTYNPANVLSVFDDWDRLMNDFAGPNSGLRGASPLVDIREEKEEYVLEAELPGLSEHDVDIKVQDRVLTIASVGATKEEKTDSKGWLVRERRRYNFRRAFTLPRNVDVDRIGAIFKDGLLTVRLPMSPEAKEKVISITRA